MAVGRAPPVPGRSFGTSQWAANAAGERASGSASSFIAALCLATTRAAFAQRTSMNFLKSSSKAVRETLFLRAFINFRWGLLQMKINFLIRRTAPVWPATRGAPHRDRKGKSSA
jgi:hypothetical protein